MKFKVGDLVSLPYEEEGVIESINHEMLWGFNHKVRITKGGTFNNVGDVDEFKEEQLLPQELQDIIDSNNMKDDSHGAKFNTFFSETIESLEHELKLAQWKHNECVKRIQENISDKYKHEQRILELSMKIDKLRQSN